MRDTLNLARVGLFFVLGIALIYITYATLSDQRLRAEEGYEVRAVFDNIRTVTVSAEVRMAGVRIGTVQRTLLQDGKGVAVLTINESIEIPRDSTAKIALSSLLGTHYISVQYGNKNAGYLESGDKIATLYTPDMDDLFSELADVGEKVGRAVEQFSGEEFSDLMTQLNAMVTDNRHRVDSILGDIDEVTTRMNRGEGTLGKLLASEEAYDALMATVHEMRQAAAGASETLADVREMVTHVKAGKGTLGELIYGEGYAREFEAIFANMTEFTEKLNSNEGTLGKLVTDDELYRDLRNLISQAERTLGTMGDSGPITAVGVGAQALF